MGSSLSDLCDEDKKFIVASTKKDKQLGGIILNQPYIWIESVDENKNLLTAIETLNFSTTRSARIYLFKQFVNNLSYSGMHIRVTEEQSKEIFFIEKKITAMCIQVINVNIEGFKDDYIFLSELLKGYNTKIQIRVNGDLFFMPEQYFIRHNGMSEIKYNNYFINKFFFECNSFFQTFDLKIKYDTGNTGFVFSNQELQIFMKENFLEKSLLKELVLTDKIKLKTPNIDIAYSENDYNITTIIKEKLGISNFISRNLLIWYMELASLNDKVCLPITTFFLKEMKEKVSFNFEEVYSFNYRIKNIAVSNISLTGGVDQKFQFCIQNCMFNEKIKFIFQVVNIFSGEDHINCLLIINKEINVIEIYINEINSGNQENYIDHYGDLVTKIVKENVIEDLGLPLKIYKWNFILVDIFKYIRNKVTKKQYNYSVIYLWLIHKRILNYQVNCPCYVFNDDFEDVNLDDYINRFLYNINYKSYSLLVKKDPKHFEKYLIVKTESPTDKSFIKRIDLTEKIPTMTRYLHNKFKSENLTASDSKLNLALTEMVEIYYTKHCLFRDSFFKDRTFNRKELNIHFYEKNLQTKTNIKHLFHIFGQGDEKFLLFPYGIPDELKKFNLTLISKFNIGNLSKVTVRNIILTITLLFIGGVIAAGITGISYVFIFIVLSKFATEVSLIWQILGGISLVFTLYSIFKMIKRAYTGIMIQKKERVLTDENVFNFIDKFQLELNDKFKKKVIEIERNGYEVPSSDHKTEDKFTKVSNYIFSNTYICTDKDEMSKVVSFIMENESARKKFLNFY